MASSATNVPAASVLSGGGCAPIRPTYADVAKRASSGGAPIKTARVVLAPKATSLGSGGGVERPGGGVNDVGKVGAVPAKQTDEQVDAGEGSTGVDKVGEDPPKQANEQPRAGERVAGVSKVGEETSKQDDEQADGQADVVETEGAIQENVVVIGFPNKKAITREPLVSVVNPDGFSMVSKTELAKHFLPKGWTGTIVLQLERSEGDYVRMSPGWGPDGDLLWSLGPGEYKMEVAEAPAQRGGVGAAGSGRGTPRMQCSSNPASAVRSVRTGFLSAASSFAYGFGGKKFASKTATESEGIGKKKGVEGWEKEKGKTARGASVDVEKSGINIGSSSERKSKPVDWGRGWGKIGKESGEEEASSKMGRREELEKDKEESPLDEWAKGVLMGRKDKDKNKKLAQEVVDRMEEAWGRGEKEKSEAEKEERMEEEKKEEIEIGGGNGDVTDGVLLSERIHQTNKLKVLLTRVKGERVEALEGPIDGDRVLLMSARNFASRGEKDGRYWVNGQTTSMKTVNGAAVRSWRCGRGRKCENANCGFKKKFGEQNVAGIELRNKRWVCFYCHEEVKERVGEECQALKWTIRNEEEVAYCHMGKHNHELGRLESRVDKEAHQMQVMSMVRMDRSTTPSRAKMAISLGVILDALESEDPMDISAIVDKLLPLQNDRRMREWVQLARASRGRGVMLGGDEGVIRLMQDLPFELIHAVRLPGQLGGLQNEVPIIFLMTTQGRGSGLDTSRRLSKGGDLEDNMVYMDGCRMAVRWTKWSASVYDHNDGKMQEVFAAFLQSESKEGVAQALALWKKLGRLGYDGKSGGEPVVAHEVSPKILMLDAAEGPVEATKEAFAHLKAEERGYHRTCQFHFGECRIRFEKDYVPEEWREEHKKRALLILGAKTKEDVGDETEKLCAWYREKCRTLQDARRMEGWLAYWVQMGASLVSYKHEEYLEVTSREEGFTTRANASEAQHSSYLSGLGGKKMQLDITTAVLTSGAAQLNQMAEARAKKETLVPRSGGPTLEDNERQKEDFEKRWQGVKEDLEAGKGYRENLKTFSRAVEEEGLACPPVGLHKIDTQTKKKTQGEESRGRGEGEEEDEWGGTHRADTKTREVRRKKSVPHVNLSEEESVEEGGTGFQRGMFEGVGDITEEDLRGQKQELDRLAKERAKRRRAREDLSDSGLADEKEEEYNRIVEELKQGSAKKRKRGGNGERVVGRDGEGGGEGGGAGGSQRSAPDGRSNERAAARRRNIRSNRVETLRPDATRFVTEWGVAKLKGVDLAECSGMLVEEGKPCKRVLNKGVKAHSEGNVVLMKVGVRSAEATPSGGEKRNVGYCARIKKCASRDCWELGLSVSAREVLPDPDTHVSPLFEGTTLSEANRAELRRERILFDESLPRLQDPRDALSGKVDFGNGVIRWLGAAPAVVSGSRLLVLHSLEHTWAPRQRSAF